MTKKYSIGTRIRFISVYEDCENEVGNLVNIINGWPVIYLPKSRIVSMYSSDGHPATVQCAWWDIEEVVKPNQQLLFDFAYEK